MNRALKLAFRLVRANSEFVRMTGTQRNQHLDAVWDMVQATYASIGVKLSGKRELLDYDVWDLAFFEGTPIAFATWTKTKYGLKGGLSGSDGSSVARHLAVSDLRRKYHSPGVYGEVSHKVEQIVLSSGAPVVCNTVVPEILNKEVEPLADGIHYNRVLGGVGRVTKVMVGNPRGVETTSNPHTCATTKTAGGPRVASLEEMEHLGCDMGFLDED